MRNNLLKKALLPAVLALLSLWSATPASARQYRLASPDGKLNLTIETDGQLTWSIAHDGTTVLLPSAIALQGMEDAKTSFQWGENVKITGAKRTSVQTSFPTPFYKKAEVEDHYNQLTLNCRGGYSVEFRAYDDGAAYRFVSKRKRAFDIQNETAEFNFAADYPAFIPYVNDNRNGERYSFSFESYYAEVPLSQMIPDSLAITPLMVCLPEGKKAVIMEAGLSNYPGMFLLRNEAKANSLKAEFAPIPLENKIGGHNRLNLVPTRRADRIYTAGKNSGQRTFPWRVVLVSTQDTQLANNDMAQRLAPPCRIDDTSWIKPGKVAWDWWNACMLTGVDFKAGMNTPTYKKYIDFAADNKLEYIIIDDGWSGTESLLEDLNEQLRDPVIINAAQRVRTRSDVKYAVEFMKSSEKNVFVVRNCLNQTAPPVLIVCRNEKNVDFLQEYFLLKGIDSVSITNTRTPQEIQTALDSFREGRADVLICTDSALGDETIREVNHVIHYDLPSEYSAFVNRLNYLCPNGISTALVGSSAPQKAVVEMKLLLLKTGRQLPDWLQKVPDESGIPSVQSNRCLWCGSRNHHIVNCPQL